MIKRHCAGVSRYSKLKIMVLMATDLPDPVVPATSKCGIFANSAMTGSPPMVLPRDSASLCGDRSKSWLPISSRKYTVSRRWFGNSIPMTLRPGTTATRADMADMERAISSAKPMTREDFVPGAGSNSYSVTTGPGRTLIISPFTPKSSRTPSSRRAFCSRESSEIATILVRFGSFSSEMGGNS